MEPDSKITKRKNTAESGKPTKKIKKPSKPVEVSGNVQEPAPHKHKKGTRKASTSIHTSPKSSRKRAAEDLDEDQEIETAAVKPAELSKPSKRAKKAQDKIKAQNSRKATSKRSKKVAITEDDPEDGGESEGLGEDQTAALLAGFESSSDDGDENETNIPEPEGLSLEQIPDIPDESKALQLEKATSDKDRDGPGVIYIGRIPHGFYESQMRAYFSQFGKIKRLRLSRNKKTGHSKHYAFIEFASAEVADIVARTMNKYLMFGHILQVAVIPPAQVHEKLFVGANKRFRPMPRNKMEGKRLNEGANRELWTKRIETEKQRRQSKKEKMQDYGYEFEFPELRDVANVPVKETSVANADGGESTKDNGQPNTVNDVEIVEEEQTTVKAIEDKPEVAHFAEENVANEKTKNGKKTSKAKKKAVAVA